jgi:kinesin family protein 6/9
MYLKGGADNYDDRGIIPRTLSLIYSEIEKRTDHVFTVYISFLEIYQGQGYDLLDSGQENKKLDDLPKVSMLADDEGNIHLKVKSY